MIKTYQMELIFTSIKSGQVLFLSLSPDFLIILLVSEFAPSKQTWYPIFIGTYP